MTSLTKPGAEMCSPNAGSGGPEQDNKPADNGPPAYFNGCQTVYRLLGQFVGDGLAAFILDGHGFGFLLQAVEL